MWTKRRGASGWPDDLERPLASPGPPSIRLRSDHTHTYWAWSGFLLLVLTILALDLGVVNRRTHAISVREALLFTVGLTIIAAAFTGVVWVAYERHWLDLGLSVDRIDGVANNGRTAALKFVTGYLIELSLSADNVFVMAMIFAHLRIPALYQHRVLFFGILGALVMRGAMIVVGTALISRFHWVLYAFGLFLLYTAYRMARSHTEEQVEHEEAMIIRQLRRFVPISNSLHGEVFSVRVDGRLMLTPLAVALVLIEAMDLIFALDSIPAAFAITTDAFLVFTSNVFAILGLRSLYFVLAGAIEKFRYLRPALTAILGVIGTKMLTADLLRDYLGTSANVWVLAIVVAILMTGALASVAADRRTRP